MSSLAHHGVKGQKWGVRRFQNPDGTRTDKGKKQDKLRRLRKNTSEDFVSIRKTLSDDDLRMLNYSDSSIKYMRKNGSLNNDPISSVTAHRVIQKDKNGTPVTYVEGTGFTSNSLLTGKDAVRIISIDLATRSGEEYRGKGYAVAAGKKMVRWFDRYGYKEYEYMEWAAKEKNIASQKTAEKLGFNKLDIAESGWTRYAYAKHSSMGGNMNYIYGNTLILGDTSYLAHHGILGQKWGIRRFQNKDGSRTAEGKKRYRSRRTVFEDYQNAQLDNVISNNKYNYKRHPIKYNPIKRSVLKKKADDLRSEYDDVLKNGRTNSGLFQKPRKGSIALTANEKKETLDAVRKTDIEIRNPEYRFHEKASVLAAATEKSTISACKKLAWYDAKRMDNEERRFIISEDLEDMYASFKKKNPGSQKEQFEKFNKSPEVKKLIDESDRLFNENEQLRKEQASECHRIASTVFDTTEWAKPFGEPRDGYNDTYLSVLERAIDVNSVMYASREAKKNIEHSSIGGNMNYIYGNTLVLGDSSYLEHHGIKNQKWGIRRFQNPDGSLTAAGRIRYGVTGAAKAAFKVGKKLGSATASAAKAGVKKAKENAYAKKKEKASQTREGVLKNKKMFTNEELERLEKRFKIEDDMRNAGLRHGQEIAKTISAYSDAAVKTMNALQTGGKAVKAISDGLSALQDYKEKLDIGKKASDAGMSTADYKEYTKAKTSEKTSNKPPNDDNPPNDGGGGGLGAKKAAATNGPKEQTKYDYSSRQAQDELNAKRKADLDKQKADLDKRKADLDKQEEDIKAHQDALVKVSKQRQSEQDARDEDLNRRDKAASEREERLESAAKGAVEVFNKLNERKANLDRREADLNKIADALDSEIGYRIDTLSELRKTSQDNNDDDNPKKKKNAKHSAIGEEMYADYLSEIYDPDYLEHFGVRGMKWGVRRYQNPDGTLTEKGKKRYANVDGSLNAKGRKIDAKRITKQLNTNDKASAWAVRRREDNRELAERNETRAEKARSKGKLERAEKFDTLAKKQRDEQKIQNKKYLELEEKNGKLVAEAISKDYDVRTTPTMRDVTNGKEHVANIALELAATMAGLPFTYKTGMEVLGMDYKVKAKKASKNGQVVLSPAGMAVAAASQKKAKHDAFQIQNGVLMYGYDTSDELEHFGLKGMKWGVRRFQNKDGSLTEAGKQRYANTGNLDSGGGGGGGAPEEEDEETKKAIDEAAKKAGMTVDEYRKKFADKVAALKEKARDAAWDARYAAEDAADAVTGKTSKEIAEKSAKSAEENERKAKAARKEGRDEDAAKYEEWAKQSREISEYRQGKYEKSLAGRAEAASKKIGAKAQEAKDKLKSRAPKRSIALEVASTGPAPITPTQIHTADMYNKYFGAVARARKTAANSTAAQRAKYGDRRNIRERAEAEELNNLRAKEKRDEAIRLRMAKKFDKKAESARAHGNTAKAEAFEKESNRQFNKAPISGSKAEAFEAARDAKLASHLVRNAATAKQAQSATLAENRNRNAAHLAERRREKAINEAKAKIRSGKLPVNELTRYAKSSVGQLKSVAKAELARREREQALTSMGSDYARATARVTTTSSTTNTADAHNEKLARDRRDKRKQAANASATAKKNRLAGSGRKKYVSGQTGSIGRVGSGRGKTSTRR